jgi:hypothetical protein
MPRIWESELLEIEMMTELAAESAHQRAERCEFFAYRRPYPHADHWRFGMVVAEKVKSRTRRGRAASRRMPQVGTL